jgi:hypothetical protein
MTCPSLLRCFDGEKVPVFDQKTDVAQPGVTSGKCREALLKKLQNVAEVQDG